MVHVLLTQIGVVKHARMKGLNMKSVAKGLLMMLCLGAGEIGNLAAASAGPAVATDVAPPPAREERAPAPRDGYVWAPGYWDWSGHVYTWMPGHYIFERRGAHWVPDRWEQVDSRWQHVNGHWEH
jgi:WXXGXW repeat (2 copies)